MTFNMAAILRINAQATGVQSITNLNNALGAATVAGQKLAGTTGLLKSAFGALAPVLSVGGLTALVAKQIEAGDQMNDLSQRTGVAVESLAKFEKAAKLGGTDLDSVAKSLAKLSKGLFEAQQTGKGPVAEALDDLGISAVDASGKLKSSDVIMLEVANSFKGMEDGTKKTALAMKLFGKSGAELIPMLNEGGDAIDKMKVKMSQAFAKKADEYNDKLITLGGKVGGLARGITVALLPALDALTSALTVGVDLFAKLPQPVQAVIGGFALLATGAAALAVPLALIAPAVTSIGAAFAGLKIAATFAGWAGAIGPAVATITGALSGLLAWIGATLVPGLLAFFSGPVGWITLAVAAVVAGVILFREPIMGFLSWVGETVSGWAQGFAQLVNDVVIKPLISLWNTVKQPVSNLFANISYLAGEAFKIVATLGYELLVDPLAELWETIKTPAVAFFDGLASLAEKAFNGMVSIGYAVLIAPWNALWGAIKQPAVDTYKFLSIELEAIFKTLVQLGYDIFIKPWTDLWSDIKKPAEDTFKAIAKIAQSIFNGIIKWIYEKYLKPWVETWNFLTQEPKKFKENVAKMIEDTLNDLNRKFSNLASWLTTPFAVAGNAIKNIFNSVLGAAAGSFNQIAAQINGLLVSVNNAARKLRLPEVRYVEPIQYTPLESDKIALPTLAKLAAPQPPAPKPAAEIKLPELDYGTIPAMARGGWVTRPTLAQIGDTGRAGGEYAIPAEMMPAAMAAWNQGARGDALVAAMRSGGLAPGSSLGGPSGGGGRAQLNLSIQTGPILQQPDGSQWVQREELAAVAEAVFAAAVEANNSSAARSVSGWS